MNIYAIESQPVSGHLYHMQAIVIKPLTNINNNKCSHFIKNGACVLNVTVAKG